MNATCLRESVVTAAVNPLAGPNVVCISLDGADSDDGGRCGLMSRCNFTDLRLDRRDDPPVVPAGRRRTFRDTGEVGGRNLAVVSYSLVHFTTTYIGVRPCNLVLA